MVPIRVIVDERGRGVEIRCGRRRRHRGDEDVVPIELVAGDPGWRAVRDGGPREGDPSVATPGYLIRGYRRWRDVDLPRVALGDYVGVIGGIDGVHLEGVQALNELRAE